MTARPKEKQRFAYFDWHKILTYDAEENYIFDTRGTGKTYGLRKQCLKDWIKRGQKYVEIVRYAEDLKRITSGYFDKLSKDPDFSKYVFKTTKRYGYIAERPPEGKTPDWKQVLFFVPLSQQQKFKTVTFEGVRRIIFDELLIEPWSKSRYLTDEYVALANLVDTIARQRPGEPAPVRLYGLGNTVDMMNPVFAVYKIWKPPEPGTYLYDSGRVLFHFGGDKSYSEAKEKETMAGRMLAKTVKGQAATKNEFILENSEYIATKTKDATLSLVLSYNKQLLSVWFDFPAGIYYVSRKLPKSIPDYVPKFGLTVEDHHPNWAVARQAKRALAGFVEAYEYGAVRFDTPNTQGVFIEILATFNIK